MTAIADTTSMATGPPAFAIASEISVIEMTPTARSQESMTGNRRILNRVIVRRTSLTLAVGRQA